MMSFPYKIKILFRGKHRDKGVYKKLNPCRDERVRSRLRVCYITMAAPKSLPYSGYDVLFWFPFYTLVILPFSACVLLPAAVVFKMGEAISKNLIGKKRSKKNGEGEPLVTSEAIDASKIKQFSKDSLASREFDIVLFGATGFTGAMCAAYIAKKYGNTKLKWAIAGRRREALEKIAQECNAEVIIADSDDMASLKAMAIRTRVVLTTAGPFGMYGSKLVETCAVLGTHYCDITGESDWVRQMVDK